MIRNKLPIITLEFTPLYNSEQDVVTAKALLHEYALFNMRGLDTDGFFDRFDRVVEEGFDTWMAQVGVAPHGWTDVAFILKSPLDTEAFVRFLSNYQDFRNSKD